MLSQLRQYGSLLEDAQEPLTVSDVISRAQPIQTLPDDQPAIGARKTRSRAKALVFAAGLLLLVVVSVLLGPLQTEVPPAGITVPGPDLPTTGQFTWTSNLGDGSSNIGDIPHLLYPLTLVSNEAGFIASSYEFGENGVSKAWTWTSSDGLTWTEGRPGVGVVPGTVGEFLAHGVDDPSDLNDDQYWRSDDGESWTEVVLGAGRPPIPDTVSWHGLTVDEIIDMSLPESLVNRGPAGVVFKVDDRFVTYYWTPGHTVEGAVSFDGQLWERFEVPEFLTEWLVFSENGRAMWDRDMSARLWGGTFASGHDKVMALTADADGHRLWESSDGVSWTDIGSTLPELLLSPPKSPEGAGLGGLIRATHHMTALSIGWSLTSWDPPFGSGLSTAYYSVDGRSWESLSPPQTGSFRIRVAGDSIFFFRNHPVDDRLLGVQMATLDDQGT
jgi:hypothetical protein